MKYSWIFICICILFDFIFFLHATDCLLFSLLILCLDTERQEKFVFSEKG